MAWSTGGDAPEDTDLTVNEGLDEMMGFVTLLHGNLLVCDLGTGVEDVNDVFFVPYTSPVVEDGWESDGGNFNSLEFGFAAH